MYERYVFGLVEKDSDEILVLVGTTSKLKKYMKQGKEYNIHNHVIRNSGNPYELMYWCLKTIKEQYKKFNIIIEEKEMLNNMNKENNRCMRLTEIENMVINKKRILTPLEMVRFLENELLMTKEIAEQTYRCMCDYCVPHFNVMIEWQEVEEHKEEKSLIKKIIERIKGGR